MAKVDHDADLTRRAFSGKHVR